MTRRRLFRCLTCGGEVALDIVGMTAHLAEVHEMHTPIKGQRKRVLHMDLSQATVTQYKWTLAGGVQLLEMDSWRPDVWRDRGERALGRLGT